MSKTAPVSVGPFKLSETGLTASTSKPAMVKFQELLDYLRWHQRGGKWQTGDALNLAEAVFGEEYAQLISDLQEGTEWSASTVRNIQWCCGRVTVDRRRSELSFRHHTEVAALQPKQQTRWLERCIVGDVEVVDEQQVHTPWTVARLRAEMFQEVRGGGEQQFFVVVQCADASDQETFLAKMTKGGREASSMMRTKKPEKKKTVRNAPTAKAA
jgi:hypothetical protein